MKVISEDKKMFSIKRLINSFKYAGSGIKRSIQTEQNLVIHMIFFVIAISFSILFKISFTEFLIIILVSGLVISLELLNTALENAVDAVGKHNELARNAKDAASGAVLIAAITSFVLGIMIFFPRFLNLFF